MHNECHVNSLVPQHSSQYIYRNYILWSIPTTYLYLVQISVGFEDLKNNLLCVLHFEIATLHTYLFSLCFQFSTKIYIYVLHTTLVYFSFLGLHNKHNAFKREIPIPPEFQLVMITITRIMNTHILRNSGLQVDLLITEYLHTID